MPDRVPIDAARLRAAVADERYWNAGHPERGAWQRWVADGYQALYSNDRASGGGGVVHVRAYVRDGHAVAAHMRGAPHRESRDVGSTSDAEDRPRADAPRSGSSLRDLTTSRRSLLNGGSVVPVMAPRRRDGVIGRRPDTILEGGAGGGGAHRPSAGQSQSQVPSPPVISRRSQELVDMIAPGGRPIGGAKGWRSTRYQDVAWGRACRRGVAPTADQWQGRRRYHAATILWPAVSPRRWHGDRVQVFFSKRKPRHRYQHPGYATISKLHF
jgi:hypothetical protein